MDGESFDDFSIEVITCCTEFQRCVEEALDKLMAEKRLRVAPAAVITEPNPCNEYSRPNILPTAGTPVSVVRIRRP
jgi:hypothetical protein